MEREARLLTRQVYCTSENDEQEIFGFWINIQENENAWCGRQKPLILGQRHTFNCIARFFLILFTFLGCPCCTNWYAWYVASKALVLRLRSVWYHGNHMNALTSDATIIVKVDSQAHVIQVHKCCTKCETFRFALPAWNLFTKKNESRAWSQLSAGQVFGKIRVLANIRNRCNLSFFSFTTVHGFTYLPLVQNWAGPGSPFQGYHLLIAQLVEEFYDTC